MKRIATYSTIYILVIFVLQSCIGETRYYKATDFAKVPKTDAHFHYLSTDKTYMEFASSLNFKLLSPIWDGEDVSVHDQLQCSELIQKAFPVKYAFFGTFQVDSFNYPGFAEKAIGQIEKCMQNGAAGIKIWKNIGMVLKDTTGQFVMIDDPAFEPVFRYLEENEIPVVAHLGEPRNCWLPIDEMTDPGDALYYQNNPQFHMFQHPEVPSYERQIEARDSILKRYPKLRFTGAHLGSLEWSIDELAKRFDQFPNFKADVAARIFHLQLQSGKDYEKVRNFMIRYQDRLIYGTDSEVNDTHGKSPAEICKDLETGWYRQWLYFATDSVINNIKGLKLPAGVIDKFYSLNTESYYKTPEIQQK